MLKSSQKRILKLMDVFEKATLALATSLEALPHRLVSSWMMINPIRLDPGFKDLPVALQRRLENFDKSLRANGSYEESVSRMSPDEIVSHINNLVRLYADSISLARRWTQEVERARKE